MDEVSQSLCELVVQYEETNRLLESGNDEDVRSLLHEIQAEIERTTLSVAQLKGIAPGTDTPFSVVWDDSQSYPCLVKSIKFDFARCIPTATVDLIGYGKESRVALDQLHLWRQHELTPGARCHAVHPGTSQWAPCVVERLTLKGLVTVGFLASTIPESGSSSGLSKVISVADVPPHHVLMSTRCPRVLRKKPENMTADEREEVQAEERMRKRERVEAKLKANSDKLEAAAASWHNFAEQLGRGQPAPPPQLAAKVPKQR